MIEQLTLAPARQVDRLPDLASYRPAVATVPRSRLSDPETSRAAAKSITPGRIERAILAVLDHPMTASEISEALGKYHPTVVSAISRLKRAHLVRDTGDRRESARGRASIVWKRA